jgi:hypothetical protein
MGAPWDQYPALPPVLNGQVPTRSGVRSLSVRTTARRSLQEPRERAFPAGSCRVVLAPPGVARGGAIS